MFGEEHCYVIDAKAYGNCGRYLNVSALVFNFVHCLVISTLPELYFPKRVSACIPQFHLTVFIWRKFKTRTVPQECTTQVL